MAETTDTIAVPRELLERIGKCLSATNDRICVVDDLCEIGIKADIIEYMQSLLTAMKASLGNDPDGITDLMPEVDELLRGVQHG
jgi:hypothetical protein